MSKWNIASGWLKLVGTIGALMVVLTSFLTGVVDTKVRVNVLERDIQNTNAEVGKIESVLIQQAERQTQQLSVIQKSLHKIDKEQMALSQRLKDYIGYEERNREGDD
jgi:hypothetical protein